jgi:hypothetical protein
MPTTNIMSCEAVHDIIVIVITLRNCSVKEVQIIKKTFRKYGKRRA